MIYIYIVSQTPYRTLYTVQCTYSIKHDVRVKYNLRHTYIMGGTTCTMYNIHRIVYTVYLTMNYTYNMSYLHSSRDDTAVEQAIAGDLHGGVWELVGEFGSLEIWKFGG